MQEKHVVKKTISVVEQTPEEFIKQLQDTINEVEDEDYFNWVKNNLIVIEVKTEIVDIIQRK